MPDPVVGPQNALPRRFKDLGDGTFAEIVFAIEAGGADSVAIGSATDAPWNGADPSASLIAIMKYCGQQLRTIADNTGTT